MLQVINQDYIKALEDKAFKLLPHFWTYDAQRNQILIQNCDTTELTYEKFVDELNAYWELERFESIKKLAMELDRKERGIDLVCDIGEFPEPDWIVEGLVVRNGLTLLYGDSGSGKTTLCLYLADAVQSGKDLFGLKCKHGVVYFSENDEPLDLLKRHRDIVGLPAKLNIFKFQLEWDANKKCFNDEFEMTLQYYSVDIVVIDALTSLGIPDITRPEMALILDELRKMAKKYNCSMLIIHHCNKSGDPMGSSLIKAKMDSMISLVNVNNVVTLTQEKVRGSKFDAKVIDFNPTTLKMTNANISLKDQVRLLKAQNFTLKEIQAKFPTSKKDTIRRYFTGP